MRDFYCQFNGEGANTNFSLENRLVFDANPAPEVAPTETEDSKDNKKLKYLNSNFDDFDNLIDLSKPLEGQSLPQSEDEMIKHHLARNVVRTDEDIDSFFATSEDQLGFKIEDGQYKINGGKPEKIERTTLADYLKANLVGNAAKAGFKDTGNEDIAPEKLAANIIAETEKAKTRYEFLKQNYGSAEELKKDLEKVAILREMARVKRDYKDGKEKVLTHTKIK